MGSQEDEEAPGQGGADAGWELRVETCRVVLWRGYTTAAFYPRATGDPHDTAIGEPSSSFRWRRRTGPDPEEARLAHHELVSRLKRDGWTPTGGGREWYETQLSRPVLVSSPGDAPGTRHAGALPEPALVPPRPAPPAPPVPRPPVPVAAPAPAPAVEAARSNPRLDAWRVAAAAGLAAAIALLGWVATHPSAVGAAPLPRPAPTASA